MQAKAPRLVNAYTTRKNISAEVVWLLAADSAIRAKPAWAIEEYPISLLIFV